MRSPLPRPATAICPRTGSRIFIGDELLDLRRPVDIVCPACGRLHVWHPATLKLTDADVAAGDETAPDRA